MKFTFQNLQVGTRTVSNNSKGLILPPLCVPDFT
jgi:hypothetical protein